jgi:hypothetical protein
MNIQYISKKDYNNIIDNLRNINLEYYKYNYYKEYKFYENVQELVKLLNKYNLHQLIFDGSKYNNETRILSYLYDCIRVSELIDVIKENNWSLDNTEKYFNLTKNYIKNIIDNEANALQEKINKLSSKPFDEINNTQL